MSESAFRRLKAIRRLDAIPRTIPDSTVAIAKKLTGVTVDLVYTALFATQMAQGKNRQAIE